jgi:hypothetical protein
MIPAASRMARMPASRLWRRALEEPLSLLERGSPRCIVEGEEPLSYPRCFCVTLGCPTSSPRGRHPEGKPLVGVGAAPAGGFAPRTREASGHRPGGTTAPVRGARWTGRLHHAFVPCQTARQPDEGNWRLGLAAGAGFRPDKRGPETENADKRSATGRADGGSIHPRRILAQWMRISGYAPRGAPLPLMTSAACERGRGFRLAGFEGGRGEPLSCVEVGCCRLRHSEC